MIVLADTSVLSLASQLLPREAQQVQSLKRLALARLAVLIGMVRQEALTGVKSQKQFEQLQEILDGFVYLPTEQADHDAAAQAFNQCRAKGIAAGDVDMLVCAIAIRRQALILTADNDFNHYARVLPITLYDSV
jgi:predicted nucleic acid-binding protein